MSSPAPKQRIRLTVEYTHEQYAVTASSDFEQVSGSLLPADSVWSNFNASLPGAYADIVKTVRAEAEEKVAKAMKSSTTPGFDPRILLASELVPSFNAANKSDPIKFYSAANLPVSV